MTARLHLFEQTGFFTLELPCWRLAWDERQEYLTFSGRGSTTEKRVTSNRFSVRLNDFANYERDLHACTTQVRNDLLPAIVRELLEEREGIRDLVWRKVVGGFAFLLLRYSLKHRHRRLQAVAEELSACVGPETEATAWRTRYNSLLSYAHRFELLRQAYQELRRRYEDSVSGQPSQLDVPDRGLRENYWWSAKCLFELALEWYQHEGNSNPAAREALRESEGRYLAVLKDEPRIHDLERFLAESRSSVEGEVKAVVFPSLSTAPAEPGLRKARGTIAAPLRDEVVRRVLIVWFLRRYALCTALRIAVHPSGNATKWDWQLDVGIASLTLTGIAGYLFLSPEASAWPATLSFCLQAVLQLCALILAAVWAPRFFQLALPRMLFGCFLGWALIVIPMVTSIGPTPTGVRVSSGQCCDLQTQMTMYFHAYGFFRGYHWAVFAVSVAVASVSFIFLSNEVLRFVRKSRIVVRRALFALVGAYFGALFWGMLFTLPIRLLLEGSVPASCREAGESAQIMLPIWFLGSSFAVLAGLLAQLLWEDKSMTEPVGEPL